MLSSNRIIMRSKSSYRFYNHTVCPSSSMASNAMVYSNFMSKSEDFLTSLKNL